MAWCHQATSHYQRQCWQDLCHNIGSSGIVVVIRLHSITWAKIYPFLCCDIVPLGHNELGHLLWDDCAFSCDQAALRTPLSVCPSIRLSFLTMFLSYHPEIFWSYYSRQTWCPHKSTRSKVKVTEVKANFVPIWAFRDHNSDLNSQMATKWCT